MKKSSHRFPPVSAPLTGTKNTFPQVALFSKRCVPHISHPYRSPDIKTFCLQTASRFVINTKKGAIHHLLSLCIFKPHGQLALHFPNGNFRLYTEHRFHRSRHAKIGHISAAAGQHCLPEMRAEKAVFKAFVENGEAVSGIYIFLGRTVFYNSRASDAASVR